MAIASVRAVEPRRRALGMAIGAVMFGVLAKALGVGGGVGVVFDRYRALFMPARYAFAIWLVIDAALIAYAWAIGKRAQRAIGGHDHLANLVTAASVLGPVWSIAFQYDWIGPSVVVMIGMFVLGLAMFLAAHDLCRRERMSAVWTVPFALYLGWVGVSVLVDVDVWLVAIGSRHGGGAGETAIAVGMVAAAAAVGLATGLRFADPVVPMVVGWALFGVWSAQRTVDLAVSMSAFAAGTACALGAAIALVRSAVAARREHPPDHLAQLRRTSAATVRIATSRG
jgi:hypothetical protein